MVWTLFVLDFDRTYDNEEMDCTENQPTVYLIPLDRQRDVEHYARMAHNDFHSEENGELGLTITDYFEEWMENNDCDYRRVGKIDLTFGERQVDYLAHYILREVV